MRAGWVGFWISLPSAISFLLGCSVPATRAVRIGQHYQSTDALKPFEVDVSQLPPEAIRQRQWTRDHWQQPTDEIELTPGYPVRVILVPATRPAASPKP
jgi:hypothetical protein